MQTQVPIFHKTYFLKVKILFVFKKMKMSEFKEAHHQLREHNTQLCPSYLSILKSVQFSNIYFLITRDDLSQLPFLTMFIKENLRFHPPVPEIARTLVKDVTLPNGLRLPKGISSLEFN